jgi:hypothetical protein
MRMKISLMPPALDEAMTRTGLFGKSLLGDSCANADGAAAISNAKAWHHRRMAAILPSAFFSLQATMPQPLRGGNGVQTT